jgi:hypothetical protein
VLLVDQFEELFTQTESEDERRRFIELVLTATTEPREPLIVLLTLRADFYHRLMQYPELYHLIEAHHKPLLPLEVDDLRATIEQPAALPDVQITFEGNLVGDLLYEMQGQAGALPLLQFTLEQLFERRSGHRLTLQAYREIGGVKGALSRHAEQTYAALPSEEHRSLARILFVRLIDPGASEQDTTRRRAALSEFTLTDPTRTRLLREAIDAFIAARLLTTNEVSGTTTIEVSHEVVIREWRRLADWMHEARQDIPIQQALSEDVAEWEGRGKPRDRLYRGSQLKEAQAWAGRNAPSMNGDAFLRASNTRRRLFSVSLKVAVLLVLLVLVSTSVALIRPPWCPTLLCPLPIPITNPQGIHDANLDLFFVAIQSTAYIIPGSPAQYALNFLPESISAMRTDGQAIAANTLSSPYQVALGVHSLQKDHSIIIEQVALVVRRALPLSYPLNVWVVGPSRNYTNNLYQVIYREQEQGATLAAAYSLPGSNVQLAPGEGDSLDILVASPVPIDLQCALQVTYRVNNEAQTHTLTLPQIFEIAFFSASSNWHLYRLQRGHFIEASTP